MLLLLLLLLLLGAVGCDEPIQFKPYSELSVSRTISKVAIGKGRGVAYSF